MVAEVVSSGYPSHRPVYRKQSEEPSSASSRRLRAGFYRFAEAADRNVASRLALNSVPGFHSGMASLFATR